MAAFTYPGVYIEEISSGVHTITGVATSIAALVGWANMGPTGRAVLVQSWSDFQNQFDGLSSSAGVPNYLGYAAARPRRQRNRDRTYQTGKRGLETRH
jgi:phage tail sheath protein FI